MNIQPSRARIGVVVVAAAVLFGGIETFAQTGTGVGTPAAPAPGTAPGTGTTGTPGGPATGPSQPQSGVLGMPEAPNTPSSNRATTPRRGAGSSSSASGTTPVPNANPLGPNTTPGSMRPNNP
jgi:hypothetical protein